ncbi:MAG: P1 family peptidase [Bryobacteraceae bacterium]|nr:P1 family peptidase [Bryobacteraceae bacterium]
MKGLTDIAGIRVGHASDFEALTGCTVILCEKGAVAGVDIRGGATGTEEMDVMSPFHIAPQIHAVVLAGGSAFGLEAASGVRRHLEQKGIGFQTGAAVVPIVPCAILYDLAIGRANVRPTREMGEAAAAAAHDGPVAEGCVGAGTGATVGKALGMAHAMKSGIGSFTVDLGGGVKVSALAAVNAWGDVVDPRSGRIVAGTRKAPGSREFAGSAELMKARGAAGIPGRNTTLAVVATNARLTKVQAARLAQMGQQGLVRTISPVHTSLDGDLCIALSAGALEALADALGVAAAEAVAQAVLRAVRTAKTMGGIPGLAG